MHNTRQHKFAVFSPLSIYLFPIVTQARCTNVVDDITGTMVDVILALVYSQLQNTYIDISIRVHYFRLALRLSSIIEQ